MMLIKQCSVQMPTVFSLKPCHVGTLIFGDHIKAYCSILFPPVKGKRGLHSFYIMLERTLSCDNRTYSSHHFLIPRVYKGRESIENCTYTGGEHHWETI